MHPFGGTPICPRCSKAVYAAEQIMGPGRKLYHKSSVYIGCTSIPCLSCTVCRKRLDSYNLVEHDQEPYCKTCHVKMFGTRDLRHANLPDRDDVLQSPPTSPTRGQTFLPSSTRDALPSPPTSPNRAQTFLPSASRSPPTTAPPLPARKTPTGGPFDPARAISPPLLKPTRNYSPARTPAETVPSEETTPPEPKDSEDWDPPVPSHNGRSANGLPRTVPLDPAMVGPARATSPTKSPPTPPRPLPATLGRMAMPLSSTPTGTRYGAALGGRTASPMAPMATGRQWGGGTPTCGKCGKTVYFAEQVRAIGKTYHRSCLRCTECNTTLDSSRLTENEGNPYCKNCYGKLHGPAGNGYALLGKAGG